jgi:transcriptional regulator with XRE-family HTH domain
MDGCMLDYTHTYLGENLRRLRHAARLNQTELARRAGLNQQYVSLIERGVRPRDFSHVDLLAKALGVPSDDRSGGFGGVCCVLRPETRTPTLAGWAYVTGKRLGNSILSLHVVGHKKTTQANAIQQEQRLLQIGFLTELTAIDSDIQPRRRSTAFAQ